MTDKRTLVHVTKGGVTEEYASEIADVLKNKYILEVDVLNLKESVS